MTFTLEKPKMRMIYIGTWVFRRVLFFRLLPITVLAIYSCSGEVDKSEVGLNDSNITTDTVLSNVTEKDVFHPNLKYVLDSLIDWQEKVEEDSTDWYSEILYLHFYNSDDKCQIVIGSTQNYECNCLERWVEYRNYLIVYFTHFEPCIDGFVKLDLMDTLEPDEKFFYAKEDYYEGFEFRYEIDDSNNLNFVYPMGWLEDQK